MSPRDNPTVPSAVQLSPYDSRMGEDKEPRWLPLSAREGTRKGDFETLHDGVPEWMGCSLWGWTSATMEKLGDEEGVNLEELAHRAERRLRRNLGAKSDGFDEHTVTSKNEQTFLDVVDFLVNHLLEFEWEYLAYASLDKVLEESGSIWTVVTYEKDTRLERRVDKTVADAARATMAEGSRAAEHLQAAWRDIYGRSPDPSDGYREATKAVEAASQPIVSPHDSLATLGKMIPSLRDRPDKWMVGLDHPSPDRQVLAVADMMEMMWKGQHDRHGTPDESAPSNVSQEEAEAALHLAVTLVHWFRSGVIRPS